MAHWEETLNKSTIKIDYSHDEDYEFAERFYEVIKQKKEIIAGALKIKLPKKIILTFDARITYGKGDISINQDNDTTVAFVNSRMLPKEDLQNPFAMLRPVIWTLISTAIESREESLALTSQCLNEIWTKSFQQD